MTDPLHGVGLRHDEAHGGGTARVQRPLVRGRHDRPTTWRSRRYCGRSSTPINIAGGEHEFTWFGFAQIAKAGALDIWQPDVAWCGGITETLAGFSTSPVEHNVPVVPASRRRNNGGRARHRGDGLRRPRRDSPPNDGRSRRMSCGFDEPRVVDGCLTPLDRPGVRPWC